MKTTEMWELITFEVSRPIGQKLREAANLSGATLDQFLIQSALEKAEKIIDREKTIYFSPNDAAMFIEMLDNPVKPNAALTKAFRRFCDRTMPAT